MKTTIYRTIIPALLLLPALLLPVSCANDDTATGTGSGESEVTVTILTPSGVTRALTDIQQDEVREIDILAFDPVSRQYVYTARRTGSTIATDAGNSGLKTFKVSLRRGSFDLVFIANARDIVMSASLEGETKDAVMTSLAAEMPVSGRWPADGTAPFPMYGEVRNVTVDEALAASGIADVAMARMMARVDVSVASQAQANFRLNSVRVYNYNTRGLVAPDVTDPMKWDGSAGMALDVSLPANPGKADTPSPEARALLYTAMTVPDISCAGEIFLFEAPAGTNAGYFGNACLVVGGYYSADGGTTWPSAESFYRVDISRTTGGTTTFLPLLRNHQYTININKVTGAGFPDPGQAFNTVPVNIEANVLDWYDGDMDDVQVDGEYYFHVTPSSATYWAEASAGNEIKLTTNYPTWSYSVSNSATIPGSQPSWIPYPSYGYLPGTEYPSSAGGNLITYDVLSNIGTSRTAYIHVWAGRFKSVVKIVQEPWRVDRIYVTPTGYIDPGGETRNVVIEGKFAATKVRATELDTGVVIDSGEIGASNSGGSATLSISPWSSGQRTVAFEYLDARDNVWKVIRTEEQNADAPVVVTVKTGHQNGQSITAEGQTFPIEMTGNWPALKIRAINDNGAPVSTVVDIPAGSGTDNTRTIGINANTTWSSRTIYIQWSRNNTDWHTISSGLQGGYHVDISTNRDYGDEILKTGQDVTITVDGYYSTLYFRALVGSTAVSEPQVVTIPAGSGIGTVDVSIQENNRQAKRTVTFQYRRDGETQWRQIVSVQQPSMLIVLASGRILAKEYAKLYGDTGPETMTWAEAMGISTIYNTTLFAGYTEGEKYKANVATGCGAYKEEGYTAVGTWSLPTNSMGESNDMMYYRDPLDMYSGWNSRQASASKAYYSNNSNTSKTVLHKVRCVREPD